MMKYEVDGKVFDDENEAIRYCAENEIPTAKIVVFEEEEKATIEESPEENPDEDIEVIDEKTLIEKLAVKKALETFGEWDSTAKAEILQQGLSITDKTRSDKPARLKGAPKHSTTESYVRDKYQKIVENLADLDSTVCPICNRPFEEGLTTEELSFWKPDLTPIRGSPDTFEKQAKKRPPTLPKVLESQFPRIRLIHIKTKHPSIWEFVKVLFEVPKEMRHVAEPYTSDPESCSEELSKEELALEICENPELRSQLFKMWKKKLENRS